MNLLFAAFALFADAEGAAPAQAPGLGGLGSSLPMFLLIAAAGFFILVMPMRRQQKQQQQLLSGMKVKDKVITSGGLVGVVYAIPEKKDDEVKEDEVILKFDDNAGTRVRVLKSSIVRVISSQPAVQPQAANSEKK